MYNRDYLSNQSSQYTQESSQVQLMSFLKATYQLFAGSLLAATAGAYIGLGIVSILMGPVKWVLFAVELALIFFVIPRVKHTPGVNLAVLFAFTFITGLTIAPLLTSIFAMPGGASIVGQAFLMTSVAFGGMMQLAIASVGALLFSAFILYDTQNIIKGQYDSPIEASLALYLDFFNLFISLLQILGIMNSGDKE
jgi:modulator of FtsH protease